jgi:hypothetical protein
MKEFVSIDVLKLEELKLEELKKVNGGVFVPPGHTIGIIANDLPE